MQVRLKAEHFPSCNIRIHKRASRQVNHAKGNKNSNASKAAFKLVATTPTAQQARLISPVFSARTGDNLLQKKPARTARKIISFTHRALKCPIALHPCGFMRMCKPVATKLYA